MPRLHLFEFEDQSWCPHVIRETTTDFLMAFYDLNNVYEPIFTKIHDTLHKTNVAHIIDCCSGSGGPIKKLREYLDTTDKNAIPITLTDKFPNVKIFTQLEATFPQRIIGHTNSLEATALPASLKGMRTFFSSFHHFVPKDAVKILQDAVDNEAPIGIFEFTQRHPAEFLRVLISPLFMLFIIPKAKRLTFKKFLFTYVLPITPFTHMWEYFVSCLRTYSPQELHALIRQVNAPNYKWEIGKLWSTQGMCYITYLIGHKICEENK